MSGLADAAKNPEGHHDGDAWWSLQLVVGGGGACEGDICPEVWREQGGPGAGTTAMQGEEPREVGKSPLRVPSRKPVTF